MARFDTVQGGNTTTQGGLPTNIRRILNAIALGTTVTLVAACGGGDDVDAAPAPATSTPTVPVTTSPAPALPSMPASSPISAPAASAPVSTTKCEFGQVESTGICPQG